MNRARSDAIARAVLYEGYNLYPYRPSALKNRQRWTFGSVFPRDWAARETGDRCHMQTECLVQGGDGAMIEVRVRFLHIVARDIGELLAPIPELPEDGLPEFRSVPSLAVGGERFLAWEEAREREAAAPALPLARLLASHVVIPFAWAAERDLQPICTAAGDAIGLVIRTAHALKGEITIAAEPAAPQTCRVRVRIDNLTPLAAASEIGRDLAQRTALASTHTLLGVQDGAFVSLTDPPADLASAASACRNEGAWPVLLGEEGERDMMLAAPIILYDYPKIAPESPGDLFDGCEIDEILTLRILTLTDEEKREMAEADPRTRALLQRTEALTAEELARLHGAFRDPGLRFAHPGDGDRPPLRVGDCVRLKPKSGGDVMDVVLRDQVAVIEAIERDFEDRVHVAVTLRDDPGRDLGMARMPGHRFFFGLDEIEPTTAGAPP